MTTGTHPGDPRMKEVTVIVQFRGKAADAADYQIRDFLHDAIRKEAERWPAWRERDVRVSRKQMFVRKVWL
jgi:hypothetical protein